MTSEQSFEALQKIEELIKETKDHATRQSLKDNERIQAIKDLIPAIGIGCTIVYYSDRRAATVTEVVSPCKIKVTHNKVRCIDYYAGDYEILPELEGEEDTFTKRRNGLWVMEGHRSKDGVVLVLNYQRHYIDPSF